MKTLFISSGPIQWGSSRMRCYWPAEYMNADVVQFSEVERTGNYPADYDAVIFQKYANPHIARQYLDAGVQVWWDLCDPLHWFSPKDSADIARSVTGIVTSNEGLTADVNRWLGEQGISVPVYTIPDRLELSHFPKQRVHADVSPVRFIWFGVSVNRISLYAALANLDRLRANGYRFELTIMDDRPNVPFLNGQAWPLYHVLWEMEKENEILASHDVALLPPYPGPWADVKSNNKQLTARASGIVPISGLDYQHMVEMFDYQNREYYSAWVSGPYQARLSADEWNKLLGSKNVAFNCAEIEKEYSFTGSLEYELMHDRIKYLAERVRDGRMTADEAKNDVDDYCRKLMGVML